ncbi:Tyrosine recombinase XerC [compost metagenome]
MLNVLFPLFKSFSWFPPKASPLPVELLLPAKTDSGPCKVLGEEQLTCQKIEPAMEAWLNFLKIRELSDATISVYRSCVNVFVKRLRELDYQLDTVQQLFESTILERGFGVIPSNKQSKKLNTLNALVSFAKYLVFKNEIDVSIVDDIKRFRPGRKADPRLTCLSEEDVERLLPATKFASRNQEENAIFSAMLATMLYTGIRVSEACKIQISDVDLAKREIVVNRGKGGYSRLVGINDHLFEILQPYAIERLKRAKSSSEYFFVRINSLAWDKDLLASRMRKVSQKLGVEITCHGLRRTFATRADRSGKPIVQIQMALGHKHLTTTERYIRSTQAEVSNAMRTW